MLEPLKSYHNGGLMFVGTLVRHNYPKVPKESSWALPIGDLLFCPPPHFPSEGSILRGGFPMSFVLGRDWPWLHARPL